LQRGIRRILIRFYFICKKFIEKLMSVKENIKMNKSLCINFRDIEFWTYTKYKSAGHFSFDPGKAHIPSLGISHPRIFPLFGSNIWITPPLSTLI